MRRETRISKCIGHGEIKDVVNRKVKFKSMPEFLNYFMKLAKEKGWRLDDFDLVFIRPNADNEWQSDMLFVHVDQI